MKLIDTRATLTAPTSLFLTRAEFKELYPHKLNSRMNYLFKHDQPKEVDKDEAQLLLKKYSHVIRWEKRLEIIETDRHQELNKIKYPYLKRVAADAGVSFKLLRAKKPVLIDHIVKQELENAKKASE